jgi:hypothetical protein
VSGPDVLPEHIAAVLSALHGRDARRAVTKAWLAMTTGLPTRSVEATIEHIRRNSIALVASGGEGYWLPATLDEAEENIERRYQRALNQLGTVGGERTLLRRMRDAAEPRPTLWPAGAVA